MTEIDKLKKRKKKALDDYYDEVLSKEDYDDYTLTINQNINELLEKKQKLESNMSSKDAQVALIKKSLDEFLEFNQLTPDILH
ncbi:hypothetical protein [Neobacillus niacini]|uniref:hypothetical protein n=1 Tax=Neobacillus niacini TaxID=86668 RepID=UPI00285CA710|nr:hypothetical protein [Neobacillus niacini]MDR6999114.1 hypothetical protein [Neobacillus niacini]